MLLWESLGPGGSATSHSRLLWCWPSSPAITPRLGQRSTFRACAASQLGQGHRRHWETQEKPSPLPALRPRCSEDTRTSVSRMEGVSEAKRHAAISGHSQKVHGGTPVKGALILPQMQAQPRDPVQPAGWPLLHLRPHRTRDSTGGKTRASAPGQSEHSSRVAHPRFCRALPWITWPHA